MIKWYIWASISGGALLLLLILICCVCCCCRGKKKNKKNGSQSSSQYRSVPNDAEYGMEEREFHDGDYSNEKTRTYYVAPPSHKALDLAKPPSHKALDRVANYYESGAESSVSDLDNDNVSVSAYGDITSLLSSNSYSPVGVAIQTSLIYSRESRYVAGKIVMVDGLIFDTSAERTLNDIKCHVVLLPIRKYALKTNWYQINNNRVKMDEYFKFKFKKLPAEGNTMLRFRVYGRRNALSKSHCLGECFVNLREIVTSRGGLTVWRKITKGAAEPIVEE